MPKDKAALVDSWDNFYVRRMKHRINDIFQRPVTGPPAASGMNLLVRDTPDQNKTFQLTGETLVLNNILCQIQRRLINLNLLPMV